MPHHLLGAPRLLLATLIAAATGTAHATDATRLLRQPSVSAQHIAFVHGGDIWLTDRNGQQARQLTAHAASEFAPQFSPDGRWVAFAARYDENTDVYVLPVDGGTPRRLTWHPSPDVPTGWSADGAQVLFASPRQVANGRSNQLFEVSLTGGPERRVMQALAFEGDWHADGARLVYQPYRPAYSGAAGWRQSRGGTTPPVWIIDLKRETLEQIPHLNASDTKPRWAGDEVVFISDRADGAANLFSWDTRSKQLRQLTHETIWDVKSAAVHARSVVYEIAGGLRELNLDSGAVRDLPIHLAVAGPQTRVQWKDATKQISQVALSATGKRLLVTARGDVFTVPVKDGSLRNLTRSAGSREAGALWSPDGRQVAYLSDGGQMRHQLVIADETGQGEPRMHPLGDGYFQLRAWSPDGRLLALTDNHHHLYRFELATRKLQRIDRSPRRTDIEVAFAPDSRWLAYTVLLENHFKQIRVADLKSGRTHALTDGMSDATSPAFSPEGEWLYFAASTNAGPTHVGLDMSSRERSLRAGLYALVLAAQGRSPLWPRGGDEAGADSDAEPATPSDNAKEADQPDAADAPPKRKPRAVRIDVDGIEQRTVALPVAERNYHSLRVAADGALWYLEAAQAEDSRDPSRVEDERAEAAQLQRFEFDERKAKRIKEDVLAYGLSDDGRKLFVQLPKGAIEVGKADAKGELKPVELARLAMRIDPRQEWRQIFDETWWMQQEFFYAPNLHGIDWPAVRARYLPLLAHVQRREDLNALLVEMIAELQVGHNRISDGDEHHEEPVKVGLLGADVAPERGCWRIGKIYAGDRWNPFVSGPLGMPGLDVKAGDCIVSVNGRALAAADNFHAAFENTAGQQTVLGIAADAGRAPRLVTVVPIDSEVALRRWDWVEHNREWVARASGGRVGYVYLPDTGASGYDAFNRFFFPQIDKDGLIVDDRRNGGGHAANYILDILGRPYLAGWKDRDGPVYNTPGAGMHGPKAMLIDQDAGSGGDFLPYGFKRLGLGPLIGTRTWGGLIGIYSNPPLIDGGVLTVPDFRFFTPEGQWRIENEGVAPDMEVELDPLAVNRGRDVQLEAAVANVMEQLKTQGSVVRKQAPPWPTQLGK